MSVQVRNAIGTDPSRQKACFQQVREMLAETSGLRTRHCECGSERYAKPEGPTHRRRDSREQQAREPGRENRARARDLFAISGVDDLR
jgi:hypothetical protein